MLHNACQISKRLVQPSYISFNNLLRVKLNYNTAGHKLAFSFPVSIMEEMVSPGAIQAVDYTKLEASFKKYSKPLDLLASYKSFADTYCGLINEALVKGDYTEVQQQIIKDTIYTKTEFSNMELWDITDAIRERELNSAHVFAALVEKATPYGMGIFAHKQDPTNTSYIDIFNKSITDYDTTKKYVYFDYWNGIGLKCNFPVNINDPDTPLKLNIRRYNDRNGFTGISRIIKLLANNSISAENTSGATVDTGLSPVVVQQAKQEIDLDARIIEANKNVELKPTGDFDIECIWQYSVNKRQTRYFNHRSERRLEEDDVESWPYMMGELYDKYLATSPREYFELVSLFNVCNDSLKKTYMKGVEYASASIVNMLIYGKTNINDAILERLFQLIRFKSWQNGDVQLDNYVIKDNMYCGHKPGPIYNISWDDKNINMLGIAMTEYDKFIITKNLIRLMNEVDPAVLNFYNYYVICKWYHVNNLESQLLSMMAEQDAAYRAAEQKLVDTFALD